MVKGLIRQTFSRLGLQVFKTKNILSVPEEVFLKANLKSAAVHLGTDVKTIFDVGANFGAFSGLLASVFNTAYIYSFEPVSSTYKSLEKNTRSQPRIHPSRLAFGSTLDKNKKIFLKQNSGWNSLANNTWIENENHYEYIQVSTIDNFAEENNIKQIELIKTDTEGYDLEVLKGADKMLSQNRVKIIICEVGFIREDLQHSYFNDIQEYLFTKGFRVFAFTGLSAQYPFLGKVALGYCNCIFINS